MMFIAAMAFGACDDDDKNDNIKVPDAVSKALKDKYPAAMDIEWERKGDYFVADCWMDGREMDVWYDVQATWKLTETDILWEGLPPTVQTAFEGGEYAQWKREDIDMLEYRLSGNIWLVTFKISYLCLPLFYEIRTTSSCHPSGCAYRQF